MTWNPPEYEAPEEDEFDSEWIDIEILKCESERLWMELNAETLKRDLAEPGSEEWYNRSLYVEAADEKYFEAAVKLQQAQTKEEGEEDEIEF